MKKWRGRHRAFRDRNWYGVRVTPQWVTQEVMGLMVNNFGPVLSRNYGAQWPDLPAEARQA